MCQGFSEKSFEKVVDTPLLVVHTGDMEKQTLTVSPEVYAAVAEIARRERRTIKGQAETLLEIGMEAYRREQNIREGNSQFDMSYLGEQMERGR